jgi:hypothetical protein
VPLERRPLQTLQLASATATVFTERANTVHMTGNDLYTPTVEVFDVVRREIAYVPNLTYLGITRLPAR